MRRASNKERLSQILSNRYMTPAARPRDQDGNEYRFVITGFDIGKYNDEDEQMPNPAPAARADHVLADLSLPGGE
jgi:hypothetical protein